MVNNPTPIQVQCLKNLKQITLDWKNSNSEKYHEKTKFLSL